MPTVITGTDGINQVQTGAVESGDLPAGSVIQVVQDLEDTQFATSVVDLTFHDSGLLASITPISVNSKILVFANVYIRSRPDNGAQNIFSRLFRDNSQITESFYENLEFGRIGYTSSFCYLDNPNTTSSVSYTFKIAADGGTNLVINPGTGTEKESSITLMEIAG